MPLPSLNIEKQVGYLHNREYLEIVNPNMIRYIIDEGLCSDNYDLTNYSQKIASQSYANETVQLEAYLKKYKNSNKGIPVKYNKAKHGYGRVFPFKSLGLTSLVKKTRNTLIKDTMIDLDLSNAQPMIILNIAQANNIECSFNEQYINNREPILAEVVETYGVTRDDAKGLFIRLAFSGCFRGWCMDCGLNVDEHEPNDFIKGFTAEIYTFAGIVKEHNPLLYKCMKDVKEKNGEDRNILGSVLAQYLQDYEYRILCCICEFLDTKTKITTIASSKLKALTYEFDGIKLLRAKVLEYGSIDFLISTLEGVIFDKTGFKMKFEEKPITKFFVISKASIEPIDNFKIMADEFELTHCKIINKSFYLVETTDKIIIKTRKALVDAYEHLTYLDIDDKPQSFIEKWVHNNSNIRLYYDMEIYPNVKECPKTVYNLWRPFAMELLNEPYEPNETALKFFKTHIKILCDNDKDVTDYIIKWIAQMIQYPWVKTICPIFISKEGCGKGMFLKLLERMIGSNKYFETSKPSRDVWGDFNGQMADSFLVNLNELSKKETLQATGVIKTLITDSALTINSKGVNQYDITSYHRFIITTNNDDPITVTKDDRRLIIISSSSEKKGDTNYFNQMSDYLKDDNVIRTCYDYFKTIPDMDKFGAIEKPITFHQKNLQESNVSVPEMWLKDFVMANSDEEEIERLGLNIYNNFRNWRKRNGIVYDVSCLKLGVQLTNLKLKGIQKGRHTTNGETKIFNIKLLKKHFGLGCLIEFNNKKSNIDINDQAYESESDL